MPNNYFIFYLINSDNNFTVNMDVNPDDPSTLTTPIFFLLKFTKVLIHCGAKMYTYNK